MNPLVDRLLARLRAVFTKPTLDADFDAELAHHLELQAEQNLKAGMDPAEAQRQARIAFGGVEQARELHRDTRSFPWLEQGVQDMRYAVRSLGRSPAFSATAVLILALGIGASTALFSVIYGVLLDPYPYAKSNEIWALRIASVKDGRGLGRGYRVRDYLELAKLPGVGSVMATNTDRVTIAGDPFPEIIGVARVSGTAFQFLGVPPILGRGISPSDIRPNGDVQPVTVLSFQLWQRRFNGDPGIIGRTITLSDVPHTIIGVMPPRFGWFGNDGLWLPLPTTNLQARALPIIRLKPGVSREIAEQQLESLYVRLAHETPDQFPKDGFSVTLINYLDITVSSGEMRTSLLLLVCAVGFLLLIACSNVANLQLARGAARSREISVRLAIGASRWRLIRQLLTESVALSLTGGLLGGLVAYGLTQVIVAMMPPFFVPNEARVTINGWVLAFAIGLSGVTGILSGLMPGLQCTRLDLNRALKDGGQGDANGIRGSRTRNLLVVVEVALSVILLVGASLAIRSFTDLYSHDWGFREENLLVLRVPLPSQRYTTLEQRNAFARDLVERVKNLHGVVDAAVGNLPFNSGDASVFRIPGRPIPEGSRIGGSMVSADFRRTFALVLRAGRDLTEQEVAHGDPVALISEATAKLWPAGESPLGRIIEIDALAGPSQPNNLAPTAPAKAVTVVGIVGDTRNANFRVDPPPAIYVPYTLRGFSLQQFLVRTQGPPMGLLSVVRAEVRALDKDLPLYRPITVEEIMGQQTAQPRFNMTLFSGLALAALALAAAGIYSVVSFNVAQRTREIGVRMALGAERGHILQLVLGAGGRLLVVGLLLGLGTSYALAKIIKSQVFDVPLLDPLAMVAAALLLSAAALFACWLPARRAIKVNPMVALRAE